MGIFKSNVNLSEVFSSGRLEQVGGCSKEALQGEGLQQGEGTIAMGELSDNETCHCLPDLVVTPVVAFAICDLEQATQTPNVLSFLFLTYKVRILIIISKGCDECGLT